MNEASGTVTDSSGNGNTGTATGTTVVAGKLGNARSINAGTDKIVFNNTNLIHRTNNFTYEWWVNWNATVGANQTYFENGSWVNTLLIRQNDSSTLAIYATSVLVGHLFFYSHSW